MVNGNSKLRISNTKISQQFSHRQMYGAMQIENSALELYGSQIDDNTAESAVGALRVLITVCLLPLTPHLKETTHFRLARFIFSTVLLIWKIVPYWKTECITST